MQNTTQRPNNYLFLTVFIAGFSTMAVEFAASRLLGNVFGTSNFVWASIIGLILIYLTLGYWLGGKLADRFPHEKTIYTVLIWAGFLIGLVPVIARPILQFSAEAFDQLLIPTLLGSFLAILILFILPVTLLGTASPIAVKLLITDTQITGHVSGKISALSTMGSFIGTFITVLVLIPWVGTYRTFLLISVLLLLTCIFGLWRRVHWKAALVYAWMPLVILLIAFFGLRGTDKNTPGLIYETESAYNYIQVLEQENSYRFLRLNEGQGMHSIYHPTELFYGGPWSQVLVAPYFGQKVDAVAEIDRIAIIGLAAGTTARQASAVYPNAKIDGFEIDPKVVAVGQQYFDMTSPNLSIAVEDGRWGITHSNHVYDIISVDAYRVPYIPVHMTTQEFFSIVKQHLTPAGTMVINVGRSPFNRDLVNDLAATISQVFPSIFVVDIQDSFNSLIFASGLQTASWENFEENVQMLTQTAAPELLLNAMAISLAGKAEDPAPGRVYTDDLAPLEWITNKVVFDTLFSGEMESLQ